MMAWDSVAPPTGPSCLRDAFGDGKTPASVAGKTPASVAESPQPGLVLPARPPATYAVYHEPHNTPNALDDFFGAGALEAHRPRSHASASASAPPPYARFGHAVVETQPGVYAVAEPPTLARMLFVYGFLFFPFWLAGICILFSPLLPTPDWEAGKTEAEKAELLHLLRQTEKKWARRCLYAFSTLVATVFVLAVAIKYGIMAHN